MKKLLAFMLLVCGPSAAGAASSVLIRTEASPKEIYLGDRIHYHITVTYTPPVKPEALKLEKTLGEFEIVSFFSSPPAADKEGKWSVSHDVFLTIFSTGSFKIPSVALLFSVPDGTISEAKTEEIAIKVKSLLEEKGDEGHLRPLKGLFNFRSYLWLWILLGVAGVVILIYLLFSWIQWKKEGGTRNAPPPRPAEEVAMESLAALEADDLISQGNIKEFYFRLSVICRQYLEDRYGISAIEKTTSELALEFRKLNLSLDVVNLLRELFDNGDLVKFAKFTPPPAEVADDLERAKHFVALTTPQVVKEETREAIPV